MNKMIFLGVFFALLMVFSVSADLVATPASVSVNGDFSNAVTYAVKLANTGAGDITITEADSTAYIFGTNTIPFNAITTYTPNPVNKMIAAGTADTITYTVDFGGSMYYVGNYISTLSFSHNETNTSGAVDVPVNLNVPSVNDFSFTAATSTVSVVPGNTFSKTLTISNDGSTDLTGLSTTITQNPTTPDLGVSVPVSLDVAFGSTGNIIVSGTLPSTTSSSAQFDLTVTVTGYGLTDTSVVSVTPESNLELRNLEWDVEFPRKEDPDDDDGDLSNGNTITVGEGSTVKISGDVKNLFSTEMEITDVEVFLDVRNMDDGDDLEEDENLNDLDEGDDDSFTFEFTVPYDEFDKGDTAIATLYVEGIDENNVRHTDEVGFTFKMEKDNEEVTIVSAYFSNPEISCGAETTLYVKIKNTGEDKIDDDNSATIVVRSSSLGLNDVFRGIELDDDEDDSSNEQTFSFNIDVSDADYSSTPYLIAIEALVDVDEESDEATAFLTVNRCTAPTTVAPITTTTSAPVTTTTVDLSTMLPPGQETGPSYGTFPADVKETSKGKFIDSTAYIVLLVAIFIVFVALVILLFVYMLRKN